MMCLEAGAAMLADICADLSVGAVTDMCVWTGRNTERRVIGICVDMRAGMCIEMCIDMCVDICVDRHVRRHLLRHFCRYV